MAIGLTYCRSSDFNLDLTWKGYAALREGGHVGGDLHLSLEAFKGRMAVSGMTLSMLHVNHQTRRGSRPHGRVPVTIFGVNVCATGQQ
jgi:hypothetical protein